MTDKGYKVDIICIQPNPESYRHGSRTRQTQGSGIHNNTGKDFAKTQQGQNRQNNQGPKQNR